jgi:hypothetical protein
MHRAAPYLGGVYAQAYDELFRQMLSGEAAQTPEQRAVAIVRRVLAAELAATYAAAQVDSARTAAAQVLVDGALEQYRQAIGKAIWLGEPARAEALKKLDALRVEIGGPAMPSRALPMPDPQRLIGSLMAIAKAEQANRWRADATPATWPIPATSPLPFYVVEENRLLIPAGALQSPLFDPAADLSAQWGGLGVLIARELMHAVDGKGATINAKGEAVAWWQTSDADAFVLRVRPLIAQYGAFEVLPGFALDGDATLYENIADLGGLQIAWAAFVAAGGESGPVVQGQQRSAAILSEAPTRVVVNTCGFLDSAKQESLEAIGEAINRERPRHRHRLPRRRGRADPQDASERACGHRPAPVRGGDVSRCTSTCRRCRNKFVDLLPPRGPAADAAALRLSEDFRRLQQPLLVLHHPADARRPRLAADRLLREAERWSRAA